MIDETGYQRLIDDATPQLRDGEWRPLIIGPAGERCLTAFSSREAADAQTEAVRQAVLAKLSEGTSLYVLHRDGERVALHLPAYRSGGEWHYDRGYLTPIYEGSLGATVRLFHPQPRSRPSSLAAGRHAPALALASAPTFVR